MMSRYEIRLERLGVQSRAGIGYSRTYGSYATFFDGAATGLSGFMIERQGPGDNTQIGKDQHRRIAAGEYPLATHKSPRKPEFPRGKYRTWGYADEHDATATPRPCIGVEGTGHRDGILIHSAGDFLHSIGCLNPTAALADGDSDIDWVSSKARVIALIHDMRVHLGSSFPSENGRDIPNAWLIITGEP